MADRVVFVLPDDADDDDRRAATRAGADVVITRSAFLAGSLVASTDDAAEIAHKGNAARLLSSLTPAESGVLTELALRPDTRSRLAHRLGITTSTLDNHLAAVKRKLLEFLETAGQGPVDGYLSTEMVIGWATRHIEDKKS